MLVHALPVGLDRPTPGARCAQSFTKLGDNVGQGILQRTIVVDLWFVHGNGQPQGWIAKTMGGTYWYEDPASAYYEQVTAVNADELRGPGVSIGGCFTGELEP